MGENDVVLTIMQAQSEYQRTIVKPGDKASKVAHQVCIASAGNNQLVEVYRPSAETGFRGQVEFTLNPFLLRDMAEGRVRFVEQNDGAGSKPHFAAILGTEQPFEFLGCEALVMAVDDVAKDGNLPMTVTNQVDARDITEENFHLFEALMRGYSGCLRTGKLVDNTGETAVMRRNITGFGDDGGPDSLWMTHSVSCLGISRPNITLRPLQNITPGMPIVGLGERGYRCNGGSQFTLIIEKLWGGVRAFLLRDPDARQFIEQLTIPSVLYSPFLTAAHGWESVGTVRNGWSSGMVGMAHNTGGGVWGKLPEILPPGVGAELSKMPNPPSVLLHAQQLAKQAKIPMHDHECYGTFHGGCGMFVVCHNDGAAANFIHNMRHLGFPEDLFLGIVGHTTESAKGEILIQSKFAGGDELSSLHPPVAA